MPKPDDERIIQLATRMPRRLHRAMKLHCVRTEQSVMDFVCEAIEEKLEREGKQARRGAG